MDLLSSRVLLGAASSGGAAAPGPDVDDVFSTWLYTGNDSTQTITNGIALADGFSIQPGEAFGGGYFAGFISNTADGVATHALIVAPRASGAQGGGYGGLNVQWKTTNTTTSNTTSSFDGAANTAAMVAVGINDHPAAQFCTNLTIGGFSDWYLPSRYELDIAYFNLKPTTQANDTSTGINNYSVPKRTVNYTTVDPPKTPIAAFQEGGGEDFDIGYHWSSTEASSSQGWKLFFGNGNQADFENKTGTERVRAFRKVPISDPSLNPYRVTGQGGLVWLKSRTSVSSNKLFDTVRGPNNVLNSDSAAGASFPTVSLTAFNADGFTLGSRVGYNDSPQKFVSWTFRKAPGFFDVVTYTGNSSNRAISHSLGSVPGTIIIKRTDTSENWTVWHRSLGTSDYLSLNLTGAKATNTFVFNTLPTSSLFYVGANGLVNQSGGTYVAYLFAHDAGGFGEGGDQSVIKCGSYTGTGTAGLQVNLGWEPQWLLVKNTSATGDWRLFDNLRGLGATVIDRQLFPHLPEAESNPVSRYAINATGFQVTSTDNANTSGNVYIYIAIRRGPMKTPTDATKVFQTLAYTNDTNSRSTGFTVDALFHSNRAGGFQNVAFFDRLRSDYRLLTTATNAEIVTGSPTILQTNNGYNNPALFGAGASVLMQAFRRAPGFFDVVAYTGNGVAGRTVAHNLGVAPELMIVKNRSSALNWSAYAAPLGPTFLLQPNKTDAKVALTFWNDTAPTSTEFTVGFWIAVNESGKNIIAYLFASCPGVSKVGSYTGTGTTLNVDCGFTAGARFVLIKRTDDLGDWYFWDTARGITAGNDPYILLNSTAAEVTSTDYIDPLSTGFQISSSAPAAINASGGSFIFLAIA